MHTRTHIHTPIYIICIYKLAIHKSTYSPFYGIHFISLCLVGIALMTGNTKRSTHFATGTLAKNNDQYIKDERKSN